MIALPIEVMNYDDPPRVGVNDEESFLGAPLRRPTGLSPFDRMLDGAVEGEVALEVISQMSRGTGGYDVVIAKRTPLFALAIAVGVATAAALVYVLFSP